MELKEKKWIKSLRSLHEGSKLEAQLSHDGSKSEMMAGWKSKWWVRGEGFFYLLLLCVVLWGMIFISTYFDSPANREYPAEAKPFITP